METINRTHKIKTIKKKKTLEMEKNTDPNVK